MAVITFSRTFPRDHPNASKPTRFVEKIWAGLLPTYGLDTMHAYLDEYDGYLWDIGYINWLVIQGKDPKIHTIRAGKRWKAGQTFSPRVWSGDAYKSHQVTFAPDLTINAAPDFIMEDNYQFYIDGQWMTNRAKEVANNDGLTTQDFYDWFPEPMEGQCIIFGNNPY